MWSESSDIEVLDCQSEEESLPPSEFHTDSDIEVISGDDSIEAVESDIEVIDDSASDWSDIEVLEEDDHPSLSSGQYM